MRLLLVEDDPKLGELLVRVLTSHQYAVTLARSVAEARAVSNEEFQFALVDWMLPDGDGLEICTLLRRGFYTGPIVMLTARGEIDDKVRALDLGADDYLTKPFELDELLARLRAWARREARSMSLEVGVIHIDVARRFSFLRGRLLTLTSREFDLLTYLARHAGRPVSKQELAMQVWDETEVVANVVEVHVSRLRDKLGPDSGLLETVRGQGYRLRAEPQ